jgi:ABC-type nitrate/sulfonate/bicarbonate transport system substrate-binding protein
VAEAVAAGSDIRAVMSIGTRASYLLVGTPDIAKVEDLKGKSFAVANPGGQASIVAELFLARYGFKNGSNITFINLGTEPNRVQAVQSGQVQATLINPGFRDKIGSLKVLMDLRDLDLGIPGGSLAISGKVLKQPVAAQALVQGTWDGMKLVLDPGQKDKVVEGLKKYLQFEAGAAESAYQELQKDFQGALPPKLEAGGVAKAMDLLAASNASLKSVKAEDVVDSSIVDKLVSQGYK